MSEDDHKDVELEDVDMDESSSSSSPKASSMSSAQKLFAKFNIKNPEERLVRRFVCSLNLKIPHNGSIYITTHFLLFSSKFPSKEVAKIAVKDIRTVEKKNTLKVIANAIKITTHSGKEFLFGGFIHRDDAFNVIQLQIRAVEEEDEMLRDQEKQKNAEKGDTMLVHYKSLKKINASEIVESLEADLKPKQSRCRCIII